MSESETTSAPNKKGLVDWVEVPATTFPTRVKALRWKQAGYEVVSAPCPACQPGMGLDAPLVGMHVHLNQEGRIICKCGAYLELYCEDNAEVKP